MYKCSVTILISQQFWNPQPRHRQNKARLLISTTNTIPRHSFIAIKVKVTEKLPKVYFWKKISDHESNNHFCLLSNSILEVKYWLNLTVILTLNEIAERFE